MEKGKDVPVYVSATFLLLCFSALLLGSVSADELTYLQNYCSEIGHYDPGSDYGNNLSLLLYNITSKSSTNKFYNYTIGEKHNKIYGLFLCNNIYTSQNCQRCVTLAAGEIQRRCPSSMEAAVWYLECMVRYANYNIFSINDMSIFYDLHGPADKFSQFNQQLSETFINLFSLATTGNSSISMSATSDIRVTTDITMSCYVDCTPDLIPLDCRKCLQTALGRLSTVGSRSGVLLQPSCRLEYVFLDAKSFTQDKKIHIALGVTSAVAAAASLLLIAFICLRRRKGHRKPTGLEEIESMENLHFEFDTIKAATDNFSVANKLGQGGFGVVYVGKLADGQAVAVKRLSNNSKQGIKEFKTEACLAAKLQHRNLVRLFGFCLEGNEMLLVYEFVPNKSLDRFLFDPERGVYLTWEIRYKIIVGIARGLLYLHEDSCPKIIHRDLKPSNILLDGEMNPKIADFGMAKLFGTDQTQGNTSRVAGTFGYMAPEYASTGHFSVKTDIFSYGIIILEIVSGRRNNSTGQDVQEESLLKYAWRLWNERDPFKLVDSTFQNDFSKCEVERCIHVGLLCTQEDESKRPNIASILLMLNTQPVTLPTPVSTPNFPFKGGHPPVSQHSSNIYQEDDVISILSPR